MASYATGDSVIVAGHGPGVVADIVGGPLGKLYRVTLTDAEVASYGFSSSYTADESELVAAAAIPTYTPGDTVLYQKRLATVTAFDPSNGAVEIVTDTPLPDPDPEVNIESRIVLPAWKVYLQQLKG
jgi:hypothetical protein